MAKKKKKVGSKKVGNKKGGNGKHMMKGGHMMSDSEMRRMMKGHK